ncbi:MAG: zinc-binding dehydrogenase [Pirellulaceae bacterium]|nr:zinc-binding dehydrogenase [Pirellulaceae bacterium]
MLELLPRIPSSSLAAVFEQPGKPVAIRDLPIPQLAAHEALVKIECCTICGSDLHTVKGTRKEKSPSILGHEAIGRIVEFGSPVLDVGGEKLRAGDRVTWSISCSCGQCDRCLAGLPQKCRSLAKYGHEVAEGRLALSGGLAQYVVLRSGSSIVKVGDEISADVLCPANCATATVACAIRYAGTVANQRVLIFGAGMLGLTAAAMVDSLHAAEIVVVDTLASRLELARQFGATRTLQATGVSEIAELFHIVLEFSGSSDSVSAACALSDIGGRVILVGTVMPSPSVAVDPEMIVRRCLSIRGVHNYAPIDLVTAIQFLSGAGQKYPFAPLIARHFTLEEINDAVEYAIAERPVRVAVYP